jgi:hypothetical protein
MSPNREQLLPDRLQAPNDLIASARAGGTSTRGAWPRVNADAPAVNVFEHRSRPPSYARRRIDTLRTMPAGSAAGHVRARRGPR